MPTFQDNIKTIETAVYGKDMRPAISEALTQGWDAVKIMMGAVDQLNSRIDSLSGGGTVDPDNPDQPIPSYGCYVAADAALMIGGATTPLSAVGDAEKF